MKKEKMQEYIMHNYEKNIHIGDVESKRRAVNGEDEVQEICEVVEENGIPMKIVSLRVAILIKIKG